MRTLVSESQLKSPRGKAVYWTVFTVVAVAFTVAFVFPLLWMVLGAMKTAPELARVPPTLLPRGANVGAYVEAWDFMSLAHFFVNTVIVVLGAWLFQLAVDVPAAYALSKLKPKLGNVVLGMMLATLMLPASALLVPTYLTITDVPLLGVNLVNSPLAIWLPGAANAFNIYLLKRFFDQIPDFIWPLLVFSDPQAQTLSVALQRFAPDTPINLLLAGLVLASVPTVVVFLIFQRNILAGLTAGSVKG
jgi:multiple sugar transport system permease protein